MSPRVWNETREQVSKKKRFEGFHEAMIIEQEKRIMRLRKSDTKLDGCGCHGKVT